jgi:glycerol-3-phosphate cytidylyltransferase
VYNQFDRARLLAALSVVDYVVIFDELTPVEIIVALKPDIHVKGGDYDPNDFEAMPEAKVVKKYGGEIKIVKLVPGHSTSNTIRKLTC